MECYVEDMLNLAMIKAQKLTLNPTNFNLLKVTKFVKETFGMKLVAKGVKLNFMLTEKLSLPTDQDLSLLNDSRPDRESLLEKEHLSLVALRKEDHPILFGDERRLKQVLLNLVKNAMKFTNNGFIYVVLAYHYETQMLVGHVRDTGVGIAK